MKNYISEIRAQMLDRVLAEDENNRFVGRNYRFDLKKDLFSAEDKLEFTVGWCAVGLVSAQEALDFANELKCGAALASAINGLDVYYKFRSDDTVITDSESYAREYEKLKRMYESNPISVVDWVLDSIGAVQG